MRAMPINIDTTIQANGHHHKNGERLADTSERCKAPDITKPQDPRRQAFRNNKKGHSEKSECPLDLWRCGELNPGPMTEPSVFYVLSPLAVWRFFCPHPCRGRWMASISTVRVPESPCGSMAQASPLMTPNILPKTKRSGRSRCSLVNPGAKLRQRERTQCD